MPIGPIVRAMTQNKTRFILIILEIAITLAIVTNCVNLILNERREMQRPSGFDDGNLLFVRSRTFAPEFRENQFIDNTIAADLRAIQAVPGVKAAANTGFLPWAGGGSSFMIKVPGKSDVYQSQVYFATAGIFETLGTPVVEGRAFTPKDYEYDSNVNFPPTAVISRALAKLMFGDKSPIGQTITDNEGNDPFTVVGVVDKFYNPYGWPIHEYVVYAPATAGSPRGFSYLVRFEPGAMKGSVDEIEKRLLAVNAGREFRTSTVMEIRDQFFAGGRILVMTMTAVIVVLVFVTALGIIGITSLSVAERTRQIGTRRALGATRGDILKHFLTENWIVTTAGLALGLLATWGLNYFLVSNVTDVKLQWPLVLVGMALLWVNGLVATIPPALRASSVSPAIATRSV